MAKVQSQEAQALIKARGRIGPAAKELGMDPEELRRLTAANLELKGALLEIREVAMDRAEAAMLRILRTGPMADRLRAAAFIVKWGKRLSGDKR
jgi:hypothetical protein